MGKKKTPDKEFVIPGENFAPRCEEQQFRFYALRGDDLVLVATCAYSDIPIALTTLGVENHWEFCAFGLLDSGGTEEEAGKWLVNPWDSRVPEQPTQGFDAIEESS